MVVRILLLIVSFFSVNINLIFGKFIVTFLKKAFIVLVMLPLFSGCYAFIHADKLTMHSSVGKKPVTPIVVESDSVDYRVQTIVD